MLDGLFSAAKYVRFRECIPSSSSSPYLWNQEFSYLIYWLATGSKRFHFFGGELEDEGYIALLA